MENQDTKVQGISMQPRDFVAQKLVAGFPKMVVAKKLVESGMPQSEASGLVDSVHAELAKAIEAENVTSKHLPVALAGGLIAALVSGFVWGLVSIYTGYEIGFLAIGVGLLCGFAVVFASGGRRGVVLQAAAVAFSLVGILVGKYVAFAHFLTQAVAEEYGAEVAAQFSAFSPEVVGFFFSDFVGMLQPFDLLWVFLAFGAAWKMPAGRGLKLAD